MDSIKEIVASELYHTSAIKREDESFSNNDATSGDDNLISEPTLGEQGNINMWFVLSMGFKNANECFEQASHGEVMSWAKGSSVSEARRRLQSSQTFISMRFDQWQADIMDVGRWRSYGQSHALHYLQ